MAKDIQTKSGLTQLYNQPVTKVEHVVRPMSSSGGKSIPYPSHHGVRITTESGQQHLVHKGPDFGKSSQTVVTSSGNMSSNWKTVETRGVQGHTVGDFVKTGGPNYNIWTGDHCITGAKRMTNLGQK